jgi:hypothetical protein
MYKYDKEELKKELTLEQIYDLLTELGAEPILKDNCIICKTICHNSDLANASHKLYYYPNTHLFHCYTGCGDASFDIYDLVLRVNKTAGLQNFTLSKAITFVARYFGYTVDTFNFEDNQETTEDWKIINNYKRNKEKNQPQIVELKTYNNKILRHLPHPHIIPWEREGIAFDIIKSRGICYNPISEGIVIPHYDINGNLIGIRERTLIKENEINGKYRPAIINGKMYNHPLGFALYNLNNSKEAISRFKIAIVYEGEKSCLKHASYFGKESDISVACCGSNLINYQVKLLLSLGVKEIVIAFDKQFQEIGDEEWQKWIIKLKTLYHKYNGYVNISFLFDKDNLLGYKDSPIDCSKETFIKLFNNRIILE